MVPFRLFVIILFSLHGLSAAFAQQNPPVPPTPADKPGTIGRMDYGPVMAHTIHASWPAKNTAYKGLGITLFDRVLRNDAMIVYDTDLMRIAAATQRGGLDISKTNHTSYKGTDDARLTGVQMLGTSLTPGWANPEDGSFKDPRSYPNGPLPRKWLDFQGYYKHGKNVVLRYTVGDCEILELPGMEEIDGLGFVTRTLEIGKSSRDLNMLVADTEVLTEGGSSHQRGRTLFLRGKDGSSADGAVNPNAPLNPESFVVSVLSASKHDWKFEINFGRVTLAIPSSQTPAAIKLLIWSGPSEKIKETKVGSKLGDRVIAALESAKPAGSLETLIKGGPAQWKEPVETQGTLSTAKSAYVIDTIAVPEKNPWNSWMRLAGFDFFKDGTRAAVSTWNGDVWIVSGIDDKLEKLTWKRFASGLYEPLGLVIKDDVIYALGYDGITRLHDLNGDGEADYYERFHNDWITHSKAYTLCLSTDSQGNFYTIANGNRAHGVPMHGCIHRVSADGSKLDVYATGLRSANGMGIGPDDRIAISDQEGNWTPASRIDLVKQGDFIGYKPHAPKENPQATYKLPLCWLPKDVDNSAGDLIWVPDDPQSRWGPMKGQLLGMSYGMCKLYVVPFETVKAQGKSIEQGGIVAFPLNFNSGIMRARFNARDGQLYLAGLKGFQTRGAFDAGFYRVRYTGKNAHMPIAIKPTKTGLKLTFTDPLDAEVAEDISSYEVLRWNYVYSEKYGSPEMSVADPKKQGRDVMKVTAASLSKDGRTITLNIDDMQPVMQMMVKMNLESVEGETIRREVYHTVHVVGEK